MKVITNQTLNCPHRFQAGALCPPGRCLHWYRQRETLPWYWVRVHSQADCQQTVDQRASVRKTNHLHFQHKHYFFENALITDLLVFLRPLWWLMEADGLRRSILWPGRFIRDRGRRDIGKYRDLLFLCCEHVCTMTYYRQMHVVKEPDT